MSPRFKPVAILPTLCTLGNTFCGFLAISKVGDALLEPARFGSDAAAVLEFPGQNADGDGV